MTSTDPSEAGMTRTDPREVGWRLDGWRFDGRPRGGIGYAAAVLWLGFIVVPLIDAITHHGPHARHWIAIVGAAAFVAAYVTLVVRWRRRPRGRVPWGLLALLVVVAITLTVADRPGWGFLLVYCAACVALMGPAPWGFLGVLGCSALAGGASLLGGASGGQAIGFAATAAGIGLLMTLMRDLRIRNEELSEARAELARLAVAKERERFARDLHDLLGHTLSVIALKAELAGRLLPDRTADAAREVAEVEQVARKALSDVREAVSGYRRPTLDGELAGARVALTAAGIEAEIDRAHVALDPAVESVLAWTVREGATNVIRHSGAQHCTLTIRTSLTDASVEVIDDGSRGGAYDGRIGGNGARGGVEGGVSRNARGGHGPARTGHGLIGLAERAELLHGWVEAGPATGGGFRLAVTVPIPPAGS